jgi:hypothetical protein
LQPALLYLVPACLLTSLAVGFLKKDLTSLFAYEEETSLSDKLLGLTDPASTIQSIVTDSIPSSKKDN